MGATFTVGLHLKADQLEAKLRQIRAEIDNTFTIRGKLTQEIQSATQSARVLEKALEKATTNKGLSYAAFNSELKKAGVTAGQLTTSLALGGQRFKGSLDAANTALALTNRQTITLNRHLEETGRVIKQAFKYTAANMLFHEIVNQAQAAVRWVTNLNDAINDIAVVTGKTGNEITRVTEQAIKGSRELRVAARDYAEGAFIFYQQGLNDEEVTRRNEITIKAAKAAGQSIEQMSQQLTAIWNTYGMVGEQQEHAASVGAKMAAQTAVEFKDIAEAMQIAAAPASQMGVAYESLAAIIATVGDTTQQSASVIGNAFKTIFSRMEQLKISGTDGEVTFKAMSQQLAAMGIVLEDTNGDLLSIDKVIEQVGQKWDTWSNKQQLAVAQLVGGTRQYGQFLALMQNYDKYLANLRGAQAEGVETLNQQYTQALDSIETRAENAAEAWHRAFSNAFDVEAVKDFYAISENLADVFGVIVEAVGGIPGALALAAVVLREKILPAGKQAGSFIRGAVESLTTEGRQRSIRRDYSEMRSRYNQQETELNQRATSMSTRDFNLAKENLQYQRQLADFDEQVALVNEEINTELAKATGERKVALELAKEQLVTDRQIYQQNLQNLQASSQEHLNKDIRVISSRKGQEGIGNRLSQLQEFSQTAAQYGAGQVNIKHLKNTMKATAREQLGTVESIAIRKIINEAQTTTDIQNAIAELMQEIENSFIKETGEFGERAQEKVLEVYKEIEDVIDTGIYAKDQDPNRRKPEAPTAAGGKKINWQKGVDVATMGLANFEMASNALDTLSDSSATLMEKVGSLSGAFGTFAMALKMIGGPLGIAVAALTTALPVALKFFDYITHKREHEEEAIQAQISAIDDIIAAYDESAATLKSAKENSADYLKAINNQLELYDKVVDELHLSKEELNSLFIDLGNGNRVLNRNRLESIREKKSRDLSQMQLEDRQTDIKDRQSEINESLGRVGLSTEDIAGLNRTQIKQLYEEKGINANRTGLTVDKMTEYAEEAMELEGKLALVNAQLESLSFNIANMPSFGAEGYDSAAQSLITQASIYETTIEEVDRYSSSLQQLHELEAQVWISPHQYLEKRKQLIQEVTAAQEELIMATQAAREATEYGFDPQLAEDLARSFKEINDENGDVEGRFKSTGAAAADMATEYLRLNRGIEDVYQNYNKYESLLTDVAKAQTKQEKIMALSTDTTKDLRKSLADILNTQEDLVSLDFIENLNLDDLQQAAMGSEEAIQRIRDAFIDAQAAEYGLEDGAQNFKDALSELEDGAAIDLNIDPFLEQLLRAAIAAGASASDIESMLSGLGISLDNVEFLDGVDKTVEAAKAAGDTVIENLSFNADTETANVQTKATRELTDIDQEIDTGEPINLDALTYADDSGIPIKAVSIIARNIRIRNVPHESDPVTDSQEEQVTAVALKNMHKTGTGGKVNSKNKTVTPPGGGKGGGKGGGGGGGGGSKFTPKKNKSQVKSGKLGERYTNVQSRIDKVSRSIDRLSKAEADAWGSKAYRNIQGINTLLGKQAEHLQELQKEAKDYLVEDQKALKELFSGAKYNDEGFISNREDIINQLEAERVTFAQKVDDLTNQYNEQAVENKDLEEAIEKATEELEKYNEYTKEVTSAMDQVDETAQKVQDTMNERMQQIREWMSNQIKQAQIKLDLKLAINDTEIRQLEHLIELWGDLGTEIGKTWKNMRDAANFTAGNAWAYIENANKMRNLLDIASPTGEYRLQYSALFGQDAWDKYLQVHGGHPQEVIDQLQTAIESAQAAMWEAQKKFREMLQEWIKLFQMYMEKFDKISSRIAQSSATLDMFVSILNATGRNYTAAGAQSAANIAAARYSNAKGNVQVQRGRYQLAKNAYNIAAGEMSAFQEQYGSDVTAYTEAELIRYQELRTDVEETQKVMDEALTAIKNGISDMANAMTEALESSSEAIARSMFDSIGGAFSDNQQALDLYGTRKEVDDYFLDKLTKDYELSKLSNQITAYLEDNDIANVERYSDLLAEINEAAQEGVEINQTDLEILQKKFELEQAVDAYEEQQKFKNTMRLARDASGNWSYVYSGEQNSAAAQQELEQRIKDNTYEIARLQKEAAEATEEAWIQTWSKIYELEKERASARYQSDEQYRAYIDSMLVLEETKLERYKDEIVKRYDAIDDRFEDSTLAWVMNTDGSLTEMQNLHDYHLDYLHQFGQDVEANADEIITDFYEDVNQVSAGIDDIKGDYTDLEDVIDDKTEDMITANQGLSVEINKMVNEGTSALRALAGELRESSNSMIADLDELERQIDELLEKLQELRNQALEDIEMAEQGYNPSIDIQGTVQNIGQRLKATNPNLTDSEIAEMAMQGAVDKGYLTQLVNKMSDQALADLGHSTAKGASFGGKDEAEQLLKAAIARGIAGAVAKEYDTEQATLTRLGQLKHSSTGNYFARPDVTTVAEKGPEIVLNPEDTQNILAAVRMVRATVNSGLASSTSIGLSIASRNASIGGGLAGLGMTVQTPVQQAVSIDANFPNVNVANEVENALDMLILQATQYAGVRQ